MTPLVFLAGSAAVAPSGRRVFRICALSGIWHLASGIALAAAVGLHAGEPAGAKPPPPLELERALDELASGDWVLQWQALRQLADWGAKDSAPAIRAVLKDDKRPWVRGRALVALAELLGQQVYDEVLGFTRNGTGELRAAAVEALGIIGSPRGEQAIADRLADKAPPVRHQAVVALARVRGKGAWHTVAKHLADDDAEMVRHATRALAYVHTPEAGAKLLELLGHDHAGVRAEAAATLGKGRAPDAILPLLRKVAGDPDGRVREASTRALAAYEPQALAPPLLAALRADDSSLYPAALAILTRRPSTEVGTAVAALIREPDERYLKSLPQALELLAKVDADAHLGVFARFLDHDSRTVRTKAVECVARCPSANPFALLKSCLASPDRGIRHLAYRAMRNATDAAPPEGVVDYLAEPLSSDDGSTVKSALELLRAHLTHADAAKAVAALDRVLGGPDRELRILAAKAIEHVADDDARRRIARAQGYLTGWTLLGPFPNDRENKGFATAYPPEKEIDFARRYERHIFGSGARVEVNEATCGGERRRALCLRPPYARGVRTGSVVAAFPLTLPAREGLRLLLATGLDDGSDEGDGVRFVVRIGAAELLSRRTRKPEAWEAAELDLAAYAGKAVSLELVVDGLRRSKGDLAALAEPRIVAGEETVADLLALVPTAKPRIVLPGKSHLLAWTPHRVDRIDGRVELHDILPPPIQFQVAYAVADLEVAEPAAARLWVEADESFKLWLNGKKMAERGSRGEHRFDHTLQAGRTRLLLKVCNLTEWWRFRVRITDLEGRRLALRQPAQ